MRKLAFLVLGLAIAAFAALPAFADTGPPVYKMELAELVPAYQPATIEVATLQADMVLETATYRVVNPCDGEIPIEDPAHFADDVFTDGHKPYRGDRLEGIPRADLHPPNCVATYTSINSERDYSQEHTGKTLRPDSFTKYLATVGRWY